MGAVLSIVNSFPVSVLALPAASITTTFPSVTSPDPAVMVICVLLSTFQVMPAGAVPPTVIVSPSPLLLLPIAVKNPLPAITEVAPLFIVAVATDATVGFVLSTVNFLVSPDEILPAGSVIIILPLFISPDPPVIVI